MLLSLVLDLTLRYHLCWILINWMSDFIFCSTNSRGKMVSAHDLPFQRPPYNEPPVEKSSTEVSQASRQGHTYLDENWCNRFSVFFSVTVRVLEDAPPFERMIHDEEMWLYKNPKKSKDVVPTPTLFVSAVNTFCSQLCVLLNLLILKYKLCFSA